jgi:3-oxoacyl-[acyl-carrier-protein] synthase-3
MTGVRIIGFGKAFPGHDGVPGRILTNDVLSAELHDRGEAIFAKKMEKMTNERKLTDEEFMNERGKFFKDFDTSDAWIVERTGIRERCEAAAGIATSDLAVCAAERALQNAHVSIDEIDLIELGTVSPDYLYSPPTFSLIAEKLGKRSISPGNPLQTLYGSDNMTACTSFVTALIRAYALIRSGLCKRVLVIGADKMTTTTNPNDRNFYPLLGDGAGAIVLEACSEEESWFTPESFYFGVQGSEWAKIIAKYGGSKHPLTPEALDQWLHKLWMDGKKVFKDIVPLVFSNSASKVPGGDLITRILNQNGKTLEEIDIFFFHQANLRMNEAITDSLVKAGYKGIVINNIERYGNTTSATIPTLMCEAWERDMLKSGTKAILCAFGGGYTFGGGYFEMK